VFVIRKRLGEGPPFAHIVGYPPYGHAVIYAIECFFLELAEFIKWAGALRHAGETTLIVCKLE